MIDQRDDAIERNRQRRAIGGHERAIATPHPPIAIGILIGFHVEKRHPVELGTVYIGRDRIDHRIPAIALLEVALRRTVLTTLSGFRGAFIEFLERADEVL